jgi:hypothetical protein
MLILTILATEMKFFRSIEGKTRKDKILNESHRKGAGVQNLFSELKEK